MENGGNKKVNSIFEAHLRVPKPEVHASGPDRERFIRDKYERHKFYDAGVLQRYYEGGTVEEESSSEEGSETDVSSDDELSETESSSSEDSFF